MSHAHHQLSRNERIPLIAVAGLIGISLVTVFAGRLTGKGLKDAEEPVLVESRSLIFADGADGLVDVRDFLTGASVAQFGSGEGGFARTALRALAYSRRVHEVGPEDPFVVGRADDGRVVIHDPSTGKTISLSAFGDAQEDVFIAFLDAQGDAQ